MKDCLEVLPIFCLFDFLEKKKTENKKLRELICVSPKNTTKSNEIKWAGGNARGLLAT